MERGFSPAVEAYIWQDQDGRWQVTTQPPPSVATPTEKAVMHFITREDLFKYVDCFRQTRLCCSIGRSNTEISNRPVE